MNPYLEQEEVWHDFHQRFCPYVAEVLGVQVRPHYVVKIDLHIYIHELPDESRRLIGRPDVGVTRSSNVPGAVAAGTLLEEAPAQVTLPAVDIERVSYVEIRDRKDRQLVTVIELLSPSNKQPGSDREQYLAKRTQVLSSAVHLVELDLLRGGPRLPLEELPACDYYAMVSRMEKRPRADIWPLQLRDRLPVIPIPLSDSHPSARLDLQAVLDHVYDAAGYEDYVYLGEPQPRLSAEDAEWAKLLLPLRSSKA
jgi:hypothetical protein